ncbi:hypothetical protein AVEN_6963-1 [Araneus ventricosus]|uniref:Uncharacterized protein n=1 Tax=Araneus ventricosus TaxID=182803 RepID=A0A4Y2W6F0_ARAVE|nr:hypothetical protein AVEN_6963-1 [Araneus ventricosus]
MTLSNFREIFIGRGGPVVRCGLRVRRLQVRNPIPLKIRRVLGSLRDKSDDEGQKYFSWCGVWRGSLDGSASPGGIFTNPTLIELRQEIGQYDCSLRREPMTSSYGNYNKTSD